MTQLARQLKLDAEAVENNLEQILSSKVNEGEIYRPVKLLDAMRHGSLNGGKRLRPFLVMQSGLLCGARPENLLQVATALECIHCYSLVHDDLPAMDDDDLRRGQPTVHKAYDEATAILAGDALLTLAFDILSNPSAHPDASTRINLISRLARASGIGGMVGGQVLDLDPEQQTPGLEDIARMQSMKTGALIRYACEAGAICGNADESEINALSEYGKAIGQAFQLADDILDVTASEEQLGKGTAKDHDQGKQTQVSQLGLEPARKMADELVNRACDSLSIFGEKARMLIDTAHFTVNRNH